MKKTPLSSDFCICTNYREGPILLRAITLLPLHRGLWMRPDPSKKCWLLAGHLCHFWFYDTLSQGLTVLAEAMAKQGSVAGAWAHIQAIRWWWLWCSVLISHTSHGCILFSASSNFFSLFFLWIPPMFLASSSLFSLCAAWPSLLSLCAAPPLCSTTLRQDFLPFVHFGALSLFSPYRSCKVHSWMRWCLH